MHVEEVKGQCRNQFSPSAMWVPGVELRFSGSAASQLASSAEGTLLLITTPKLGSRKGAGSQGGAFTPGAYSPQVEGSPSLRWQMALYRGVPGREEDADDPEKIVRRVQEVSAVLYHLDQVGAFVGCVFGQDPVLGLWAEPEGDGRG